MSDEAETIRKIEDTLMKLKKGTSAQVRDIVELIAIDPRSAYPYMSKQEFNAMMAEREKKKH